MDTQQPEELILVVHGVGDPQPGETLDYFCQALATPQTPLSGRSRIVWINEDSATQRPEALRFNRTFAAHERQIEFEGHTAQAAEVYWGDLSRVRRGILGAIFGTLQVVFGLRYVAFVAADQPGLAAMWLRRLAMHSARLIHGPVLAVNFILALLALMLVASQKFWQQSCLDVNWADWVATVLALSLMLVAGLIRSSTKNRVVERFWFWVFAGGVFLGITILLRTMFGLGVYQIHTTETRVQNETASQLAQPETESYRHADAKVSPAAGAQDLTGQDAQGALNNRSSSELAKGMFWYCRVFVVLLGMQYLWVSLVLVAMVGCWVLALLHPHTNRQGLHVGFLVPTLLVGFWAFVIPMVWVTAGEALKQLVQVEPVDWLFHEAVPLLGLQCVLALFLALTMVGILAWYGIWRVRHGVESFLVGSRSPRLILHPVVQFCTGACALFGISISMFIHWAQFDGSIYNEFALGRFLVRANYISMTVLIPLGGMLFLSLKYLRPALDIVLDVVNHFYLQGSRHDEFFDDDDEFEFDIGMGRDSDRLEFSRRRVIGRRLEALLEYYGNKYDHRPRLNILSHSQGTLITAEVLNRDETSWLRDRFSEINLVTMGSPIHHLYQFYFPHVYPAIDQTYWHNLRRNVDRWMNIFRIDDFVGTEIPFAESLNGRSGEPRCSNHPVESAGHLWYWTDKQVLGVIADEAISPSISQAVFRAREELDADQVQHGRGLRPVFGEAA